MDELIEQSRAWVKENYGKSAEHLLKAEEWLRRIHLAPSQAMLLATLTHDMERAFPGSDSPKQDPSLGPDDSGYNQAHSERSARIVSDFLREHQASDELFGDVARMIRLHEVGGWPDAAWVQPALLHQLTPPSGARVHRVGALGLLLSIGRQDAITC